MMDNKQKTGKADDSRIDVNESYELQYWSEKFDVSRDELREAVKSVGPIAKDVEKYFQSK
ncbi:MAG: DUF3606 domain-containing protein [Flavobacterium sp.]|nr:MAG: DUF3606 domain-containing protein [Flavobacterium sp.]